MNIQHYHSINVFFDYYGLSQARSLLHRMVKTADAKKIWAGRSPSELLFFTEKIEELMAAVFSMVACCDYKPESILDKDSDENLWSLTVYKVYCSWHIHSTPWDFFPRHLSKKEFLNPYRALKKFTRYRSLDKWKDIVKDLLTHALSPNSINEFDEGNSLLLTYIYLQKLFEATHLIEVRREDETNQRPRNKWKDPEALSAEKREQAGSIHPPRCK